MSTTQVSAADWLSRLLNEGVDAGERTRVGFRLELDPELFVVPSKRLERVIRRLVDLARSSAVDGATIDLACVRSAARVAPVGSGQITLRWQVPLEEAQPTGRLPSGVIPLRPRRPVEARAVALAAIGELGREFRACGWSLRCDPVSSGRELLVRVSRP